MASNAIPAANVVPYIPEMWSTQIKAEYEAMLEIVSHCTRKYEKELTYGDTLNVPNLSNFGTASTMDYTTDLTLYDVIQNTDQIIVNYKVYKTVGLGFQEAAQNRPDFLKAALGKCVETVTRYTDDKVAELVPSLTTNTAGTEGEALTADVFIAAFEGLNENKVPQGGRIWALDPESITDILGIDYFVSKDYGNPDLHARGYQNRMILGSPVYMTTNLNVVNSSYHAAVYFQEEWVAVISEVAPTIISFMWEEKFTDVTGVKSLFGVKQMREPSACWIKTRS